MMKRLNQPWRAVYTSLDLMAEVENGGFHQFFWNSEGKVNAETEEGLQFLGATPYHGLFTEARKIFEAHDYVGEKADTGNTWEGFTAAYKEKRMGELDTSFYKQPKRLDDFIGDFIKAHPELYTK